MTLSKFCTDFVNDDLEMLEAVVLSLIPGSSPGFSWMDSIEPRKLHVV
jgi:hypothetical protein